MPDLTIVAVPKKDDYVWKISSEKVPHLTLMYLGDVDEDVVEIARKYLAHIVKTTMRPFGLSVDRRGTLGPKDADVLFFDNDGTKQLVEARMYLLKNDAIAKAYDAVEQYPSWIPHLTLGYPSTPAREDKRDYPGTSWINFDTVAIWDGDYSGEEFVLRYPSTSGDSMSDDPIAHYGIKGMRWGVRRSASQIGASNDHEIATAARVKAKRGGVKSLSNAELKTLVERMNLEVQYERVVPTTGGAKVIKTGSKIAGEILANVGKQHATRLISEQAGKLLKK